MSRRRPPLLAALAALLPAVALGAASVAPPLDNAAVDELAFRTYLHARLGDRENALKYAGEALAARPGHIPTLLALASLWEADREGWRLDDAASRLLAQVPDDEQALFFKATADFLLRHHAQARAELLAMRAQAAVQGREFPYDESLAEAAARSGDWISATRARTRLAGLERDYATEATNRASLDALLRAHLTRLSAEGALETAPGRHLLHTVTASGETPVSGRARLRAEAARRHAELLGGDGFRADSADYLEALATGDYAVNTDLVLSVSAGATGDGDPRAGASLTNRFPAGLKLGLIGEYAAPAEDDAPYCVANIRQTRLLGACEKQWTERTGASLSGGLRSLHPPGEAPENPGWILTGEVFHQSRQRLPGLKPYLQTLWASNPENAPVARRLTGLRSDGLNADVKGTFDLQKAGVRMELPLRSTASLALDTYAGSSLLDGGIQSGASAELRWRPVKSVELLAGAGWDKGTIFNNLPSGVIRATTSLVWFF